MERLSEEQRVSVFKMAVDRLRSKLVQAGYRQDDVDNLDRPKLLQLYVQVILTETAYVPTEGLGIEQDDEAEGGVETQTDTVAVDRALEFEERRLLLEERKLEEQRLQRQLEEKNYR